MTMFGEHPMGKTMTGSLMHADALADDLDECSTRLAGSCYGRTREIMRASARMIRAFQKRENDEKERTKTAQLGSQACPEISQTQDSKI